MKKQQAFTLLELLVTSSITALLMLSISSLFITFLATAYKSRISQNLRESGSNATRQIIDMVRGANEILSSCDQEIPLNYIVIVGQDGLETTIIEDEDRIASISANNKFYLTESSLNPDYLSDLIFRCYPTTEGKKYIEVSFSLHSGDSTASNSAKSTTLEFGSGAVTRN